MPEPRGWKCPECHRNHWKLSMTDSGPFGRIEGLKAKCMTKGCPVEVAIDPYVNKPELWGKRIDPKEGN